MTDTAFSFAKPEDSPGFLLWKVTTIWQRLVKKELEPYGISHAQFVIMAVSRWFYENNIDCTQVAISNKSGLDKMTVSKSLKKLVEQELVKRVENKKDTRAKIISLTEKGAALIKEIVPKVESMDKSFFANLQHIEQQELKQAFTSLIENYPK